jgi:hypothetical protein
MASWETLNNERHAALRVSQAPDVTRHFAQIVADEFVPASHDFPILFTKHPETGAFYAGVVMGIDAGTNLACVDGRLPGYRPADLERQGFFLVEDEIVIDRDHPAFAESAGASVFEADGTASAALRRVQHAIGVLQNGLPATDAVIARFMAHRLLEPIDISLSFDDGREHRLDGLYTISLDRLHALPDDVALELFRAGDLQLAYAQTGSLSHIKRLARRYNERLADPSA